MSAKNHALHRALRKMSVQVVRDVANRRAADADSDLAEREEQQQLAVSGVAADLPSWSRVTLRFQTRFSIATGNRDSSLQRPHLYQGHEVTIGTRDGAPPDEDAEAAPVIMHACVVEWTFDEALCIDGCVVAVAATAPGDLVNFQGFIHLTFQGLGLPQDQPDEGD